MAEPFPKVNEIIRWNKIIKRWLLETHILYTNSIYFYLFSCELWEKVFFKDLSKLYRIHVLLNDTFFSILESLFQISLLHYIASISNILTYFKSKTWLLCKPLSPFHCDRVENIWLKKSVVLQVCVVSEEMLKFTCPYDEKMFCCRDPKGIRLLTW